MIDDRPADGAWNMALDRALQIARERGESPPTLRLYTWASPTVTLGRFQDVDAVDADVCEIEDIDVVRRFTGGRGVLHDDEITYSMIAGLDENIPRGTAASYRVLCGGLVEAYRGLGVQAALTSRPRGDSSSAACYLHATAADLSLGALKLSGSAQVWHGSTVLQHGSFTVSRDVSREARVFGLCENDETRLAGQTVTIADSLGRRPSREELLGAIIDGIGRGLGVELVSGTVSAFEDATAHSLLPSVDVDGPIRRVRVRTSG